MAVVSSLGAPLIPTLSQADGVSLSTGEWILTITLLTGALATPVMGRLADGPRQRAVILVALGAVVAGCVLSAVSNGFTVLIIGRALQGVGLGLLPVAMAIARRNLPPEQARRTIATLSVTTAIGAGLGYPVTGLIAQFLDFRAAYWFGAITVTGSLVLAALVLPPRSAGTSRRFDVVGAGLLSLAVIGVSVVLSEGGAWGWASARSLGVVAASVVLLAAWIPFELRFADPLVDLRQVRNRSVLTADASGFLISIAMYLLLPIIVEFVQIPPSAGYGFAASLVVSGLVLIPLSVGSFVASRFLVVLRATLRLPDHDPARLGGVRGGRDVLRRGTLGPVGGVRHRCRLRPRRRLHHRGDARVHRPGRGPERDRERYGVLPGGAQHRLDGGKRAERRGADGPHPARPGPAGRGRLRGGPDHRCRPVPGHRGGQLRAAGTGAVAPQRPHHGREEDLGVL